VYVVADVEADAAAGVCACANTGVATSDSRTARLEKRIF
jgi:hypothetical protein